MARDEHALPAPERGVRQRACHRLTLCDDPRIATVRILGAGGWIPTGTHATCSALLREGGDAVLIDAGTGIERIVSDHSLLDGVERLHLVLTHFHLDHVAGLGYAPGLRSAGGFPPTVWGPGEAVFGISTEELLRRLCAPPFYDADFGLVAREVRELAVGEQAIGPFTVTARRQEGHSTPTLALRFGDLLSYCTDTPYDEGNAELAAGSRVLMHEAWFTEPERRGAEIHSSGRDAGAIARAAGVERLVLIHLHPLGRHEAILAEARAEFPAAELGHDLLEV